MTHSLFMYIGTIGKEEKKLQASWSKWVFSGDVIGFSFNLADIYLLIKRGNNLFLERINLSVDEASTYTDGGFSVHLDRRVILQTGGLTAVPYTDSNTIYVTEDGGTLPVSGVAAKLAAGEVVFAGIPFTFKYQFSEPVAKINNTPVTRADLRIRNWSVSYNDTGFFSIKQPCQTYYLLTYLYRTYYWWCC